MRKLIASVKSLAASAVTAWLGWTAAITGMFVAVGGAVWAVVTRVPLDPQQWLQVVSVFLAAFLAMCTGIGLEIFKTWRANRKEKLEQQAREVTQVNLVISGMGFNISSLLHVVSDFIIPHHTDGYRAFADLRAAMKDPQQAAQFAATPFQITYQALVTTCPEIHLIEWDFFKDLPFIVEKDPELLPQTGWLIDQSRALVAAIKTRNGRLVTVMDTTAREGGLKFTEVESILHYQISAAKAECVISLQLFELLLDIEKRLEAINDTYKIRSRKTRLTMPKLLQPVVAQLREIVKLDYPNSPSKNA